MMHYHSFSRVWPFEFILCMTQRIAVAVQCGNPASVLGPWENQNGLVLLAVIFLSYFRLTSIALVSSVLSLLFEFVILGGPVFSLSFSLEYSEKICKGCRNRLWLSLIQTVRCK